MEEKEMARLFTLFTVNSGVSSLDTQLSFLYNQPTPQRVLINLYSDFRGFGFHYSDFLRWGHWCSL
jgi:hypothetical protein